VTQYIPLPKFVLGQRVCVRATGKPAFVGHIQKVHDDDTYNVDSFTREVPGGTLHIGVRVPWTAITAMAKKEEPTQ
jgi:hypothetical protein